MQKFDAIVIGSGIGGLTVASLLTQVMGKRVLVLEKHFKLGGLTHTFRRQQFEWDVGLHYVGQMHPGSMSRKFMDLVTGGGVQWRRMDDPLEQFLYPGLEFQVPGSEPEYLARLMDRFPESKAAILAYFRDLHAAASWARRNFAAKTMPALLGKLLLMKGKKLACATTASVLEKHFPDRSLRALMASQWGDYGLSPRHSAFAIHAVIACDYLGGGFYPEGGAATLANSIVPIIEANGGQCLVNHPVTRLEIENQKVTQVWCEKKGKPISFTAPLIISAVGAHTTYQHLVPSEVKLPERALLKETVPPATAVTLYVGLREDPRKRGFQGSNYWMYDSLDHEAIFDSKNRLTDSLVRQCFLSFPSLRVSNAEHHTAELITFSDFASWQTWAEQPWLKRDTAYQTIKTDLARAMLDFVERFRPGFKDLVEYSELSTPLTVTSMAGHSQGAIYGHPATPTRYKNGAFPIRTSLRNLYLTGCDVGSLGINGALFGGVMSTALLLGPLGFPKLLAAANRKSKLLADGKAEGH